VGEALEQVTVIVDDLPDGEAGSQHLSTVLRRHGHHRRLADRRIAQDGRQLREEERNAVAQLGRYGPGKGPLGHLLSRASDQVIAVLGDEFRQHGRLQGALARCRRDVPGNRLVDRASCESAATAFCGGAAAGDQAEQ